MISDEDERVGLVRKINPQAANVCAFIHMPTNPILIFIFCLLFFIQGLVEIWLKEVEFVMLDSVLEQMKEAWEDYALVERVTWVVSWPGQVVLGISCMAWTYEVGK